MEPKGKFYEKLGRKIYVSRGICDYFSKGVFERLYEEAKYAKDNGAEFYVGIYSDDLLKHFGKARKFEGIISNEDRIKSVEALKFVDGAFLIPSLDKNLIDQSLNDRLIKQEEERRQKATQPIVQKKYGIGYASGAFSNLHKGHIEHIQEMASLCETVIVAANSDRLITEYKHKTATVDQETRRKILSEIRGVDIALVTDEYDKMKAVDKIREVVGKRFDAIFVGSDWKGSTSWENFEKELGKLGIEIVYTDRPKDGISTSKIDAQKLSNRVNGEK